MNNMSNFSVFDSVDQMLNIQSSIDYIGQPKFSPTVYHYTSIEALANIISNKKCTIRFSDVRYMNDPLELKYYLPVLLGVADDMLKDSRIDKVYFDEIKSTELPSERPYINHEGVIEISPYNQFILSASSEADELPMWNYYSKSNGQCNLKLSTISDLKRLINLQGCDLDVVKVIYDNEEQKKIIAETLLSIYCIKNKNIRVALLQQLVTRISICFKQSKCSFEKEIRVIIKVNTDNLAIPVKFRWAHNLLIPYIEIELCKKAMLRDIKLGPLSKNNQISDSVKYMLEYNGFKSTSVSKSEIDMRF